MTDHVAIQSLFWWQAFSVTVAVIGASVRVYKGHKAHKQKMAELRSLLEAVDQHSRMTLAGKQAKSATPGMN